MRTNLLLKVFVAIVLAIGAGLLTGPDNELFGVPFIKIYGFIGQLFLNALNLVVVPLVCASIIIGTAKMGSEKSFGFLGAKTFGFYILTTLSAVLIGLCGFLVISPWVTPGTMDAKSLSEAAAVVVQSQGGAFEKITDMFNRMIPTNILAAASQGQMLGLILFSIIFGLFIPKIESEASAVMLGFWKALFEIMMKITHLVMKALPLGVFGLVAKVTATIGWESIEAVGVYSAAMIGSLVVYSLAFLPMLLLTIGGVNPILLFRALAPALFTAFSTSSSAATLPVTMECVEKRAGVSNRICSFSIPLGTSLNMSGCAMYLCLSSLFLAHSYGIELPTSSICLVVMMSVLTSMGIAGIPSSSLIALIVILQTIGVPAEGVGLIMAVDRILDMFRTAVNVLGNSTCAILLARSEGECDILSPKLALSPVRIHDSNK